MIDASTIDRRVAVLLARHGRTFADELDIPLARGTPADLFRWPTAAILYAGRIRSGIAGAAAPGLPEAGWTHAEALAASRFEDRVAVLDAAHYTRYDERLAQLLADAAVHVRDSYDPELREAAGCEAKPEQQRLRDMPGLGPTGAQIFGREAQTAWAELYPFCHKKAWSAARELELAGSVRDLAELVPSNDFVRLVAALARASLAKDRDVVHAAT